MGKLNEVWVKLDVLSGSVSGVNSSSGLKVVPTDMHLRGREVMAGVGHRDGLIHFLLPSEDLGSRRGYTKCRGVEVRERELVTDDDEKKVYVDICCRDAKYIDIFKNLVANVVQEVEGVGRGSDLFSFVVMVVERWRSALGTERRQRLTERELAGLYAELLFLSFLMQETDSALELWRGPDGGAHDFRSSDWCVEVKATLSPGSNISVHGLEQLEQLSDRELYLGRWEFERDLENGRSVSELIEYVCRHPSLSRLDLMKKLLHVGYQAEDEEFYDAIRFSKGRVSFYHVIDGFPRITRKSVGMEVSNSVAAVSYELKQAAIDRFEVASDMPEFWHVAGQ